MTGESGEGPVGPRPVSAKAVYRLADKLDLPALKLRAFQHIISQLTPYNIPAEVFSRFSTMFDEVRKVSCRLRFTTDIQVQLAYFLKNWAEIKKSDTMKTIWSQIRTGKHVGFEEGGWWSWPSSGISADNSVAAYHEPARLSVDMRSWRQWELPCKSMCESRRLRCPLHPIVYRKDVYCASRIRAEYSRSRRTPRTAFTSTGSVNTGLQLACLRRIACVCIICINT